MSCETSYKIKHYVGEIGTNIIVYTGQDLTTATNVFFNVKKPDGTILQWDAEKYTIDGKQYYMVHALAAGDFNIPGEYELQSHATIDGWDGYGSTAKILVYNLFT